MKTHVLTGYGATSQVGTNAAILKVYYHLLASFKQNRRTNFLALKQPEKHLCSVLYPKEIGDTFDDLRYILYTKRNKTLSSLPPTTNIPHEHILRSHYVILLCSNLGTRHKFESCGNWLEFNRFSSDAQ